MIVELYRNGWKFCEAHNATFDQIVETIKVHAFMTDTAIVTF